MNSDPTIASELRSLLSRRPFKPFKVHTSDQAEYSVPQVDWAMVHPRNTVLVVMDDEGLIDWVALSHITRISPMAENAAIEA